MKKPSIHMRDQKAALVRIGNRKAVAVIDEVLLMLTVWGLGFLIAIS
jgi:hypothetical protein